MSGKQLQVVSSSRMTWKLISLTPATLAYTPTCSSPPDCTNCRPGGACEGFLEVALGGVGDEPRSTSRKSGARLATKVAEPCTDGPPHVAAAVMLMGAWRLARVVTTT